MYTFECMALLLRDRLLVTPRQREILGYLARGDSNKEIADQLGITEQGVKSHISRMLARHGATNRTELVAITQAWAASDTHEIPAIREAVTRMRGNVDRHREDGNGRGGKVIDMGQLSARSRRLSDDATDVTERIERLRKIVGELNVAIELARELPASSSARGLANAVRKRAAEADKQLAALERALSTTRR